MDNPETLVTLGTQDTGRRHTRQHTKQKTRKMKSTGPTKKPWVNPCVLQWLALPASYKAPVVFKFGRNLVGDRGKKRKIYVKRKLKILCHLRYGYFN
jgi:hypothetical protein